jgi:hypothetical protein
MTRGLTTTIKSELAASHVRIGYFFEIVFDTTPIRLSSTFHNVSWDSKTWLGNGWFHGADSIVEDEDLDVNELTIYLSGVNPSLLSAFLTDSSASNTGALYLVFFDSTWTPKADPYLLFEGNLNEVTFSEESDNTSIEVSFEDKLSKLDKASDVRWTHNFQQTRYSGDNGFNYVQSLEDWDGYWGTKKGNKKTKKDAKQDRNTNKKKKKNTTKSSEANKRKRRQTRQDLGGRKRARAGRKNRR